MSDTSVKCPTCSRVESVRFGGSVRHGWPLCCGGTMTLVQSAANIDQVVKECLDTLKTNVPVS